MAKLVFAGGHDLEVREDAPTVIQRISVAAAGQDDLRLSFSNDGGELVVKGWFAVTARDGMVVAVRPGAVAYVLP